MRTKTYMSDGSDGYSAGTYGYIISGTLADGRSWTDFDGGFSSRRRAYYAAQKRAKAMLEATP